MENQENIQSSHKQQTAMRFKAFLQKNSTKTGINLYDHMVRLLTKVLEDQPENVVDIIEDMSQDIKRSVMLNTQSTLRDIPSPTEVQNLAEQQKTLFVQKGVDDINNQADVGESPLPNLQEIAFYLAQAGIGLGQEEMFRVFLSLKQLLETQSLLTCRFWGKILGIESSYLVAEVQLKDDEEEEEEKSVEAGGDEEEREFDAKKKDVKDEEKEIMEMELPKSTYRAPPEAPKEENHKGCNKFTYFVCKEPGLPWVRLPPVTPTEITTARQIRKFFTGNLDSPVVSYPPFPGNEANYLRAQIARISAATQVSPLGFYHFGEEEGEEEEEEEVSHDNFEENPEFDGIPVSDLVESLSTWVHHVQYILPQGRCVWVNMAEKPEKNFEEDEEDEEEEKEEEPDEPEPEVGPPLLTPLTEDAEINNTPPWITRTSSILIPQYAIAVLHSKLWPGAYAYGIGKRFENVYIGWGLKFTGESYGPPLPPAPQEEYPSGPDISEIHDPSVMEEEAQKAALEEEGGSQGEAEELDDAEDDEDDDG